MLMDIVLIVALSDPKGKFWKNTTETRGKRHALKLVLGTTTPGLPVPLSFIFLTL